MVAVIVPVIGPQPPSEPQVIFAVPVPPTASARINGFVNFGHGVFFGGALVGSSVGSGVSVGAGVFVDVATGVFVGVGDGGITPSG